MELKRRYVIDDENRKVAVQIDIDTFEKLEEILENYGLAELIAEDSDDGLDLTHAREYYATLTKAE
ncbi:hypothetical protein [Thiocapsa roseopersicina]|uniref:Uncharacterized protein n=1 Tax=Thiocapsa roseopersicina TaxID=1058 RepID=A0A1H2XSV4_THIRO|nr:hypothetical protein [Thiocapsa roseopersicina]SDW96022.1 hypothetical protein SAMN05421783_111104 [Thiocapsa roseopersicina]